MTQQFYSWRYIQIKLIQKDTWTSMFIVALFTIVKLQKQWKRPATDEWIKKTWCIHTEYRSDKNEVMPRAATWMNLEVILLSEVGRRKTNTVWYHLPVESKKSYKWVYSQNSNWLTDKGNKLMYQKGKRERDKYSWPLPLENSWPACVLSTLSKPLQDFMEGHR